MKKGRTEPPKWKEDAVEELANSIDKSKIVGILNLHKMPAAALQKIKRDLHDEAKIKVSKKMIIERSFKKVEGKKILLEKLVDQNAVLFTETEPFKIYKKIRKSKSKVSAKPGDVAPDDIVIRAGPTDLPPGPAISALTKVKIPAKVEGAKIGIMKDVVVCRKGEKISPDLASALNMLKIQPIEVGLDVVSIWEDGIVYGKDALDIDSDKVLADLVSCYHQGISLSIESGYPTKDSIKPMITKAFREARELSLEAGIINPDIIGDLLSRAVREASELGKLIPKTSVGGASNENSAEEKKEERADASNNNAPDSGDIKEDNIDK